MTQYGSGTPGFGLVSAGVVLLLVLLALAAIWVARSQQLVPTLVARAREVAVVGRAEAWAREQLDARVLPLVRRFPAYEVLGVALLAGLSVVVTLAVAFNEVLEDVLAGEGVAGIDRPTVRWLATHRDLWLTATLKVVCGPPGVVVLAAVAVLTIVVAARRSRSWAPVVFALVGGVGIAVVLFTVKASVIRDRPPIPFAVVSADGFSFPSGHAAGIAGGVGITAWLLTSWLITGWTGRVVVWTVAVGVAVLMGFSRVYLGVHYVSDVLAGWLLGAAWASAVMAVGSLWISLHRARAGQPAADDRPG